MLTIEKARQAAISAWRRHREWGTVGTVDDSETVEYEHGWFFRPTYVASPGECRYGGQGDLFVDRKRGKCWWLSGVLDEVAYEIECLRLHGKPSGSVPHPIWLYGSRDSVQDMDNGLRQLRDCLMQHVDWPLAAIDWKVSALRKGSEVVVSCKSASDVSALLQHFEEGKCVTAYRVEWPGREPYFTGVMRRMKEFFNHYY